MRKFPCFFDPKDLVLSYWDDESYLVVLRCSDPSVYSIFAFDEHWACKVSSLMVFGVRELCGALKVLVEHDFGATFRDLRCFDPSVACDLNIDLYGIDLLEDYK